MKIELVAEIDEVELTPPPKRYAPGEYAPERNKWKLQAVSADSQNVRATIALDMAGVAVELANGRDKKFKVTIEVI